jgi:hypothetical protein
MQSVSVAMLVALEVATGASPKGETVPGEGMERLPGAEGQWSS